MKSIPIPRSLTVVVFLILLGFVLPLSDASRPVLIGATRSLLLFAIVAFFVGGVMEKKMLVRLANVLVSITLFAVFLWKIPVMKNWDLYSRFEPIFWIIAISTIFYTSVRFFDGFPSTSKEV